MFMHFFFIQTSLQSEVCLFLDSSWSQRGLVWYWHPVRSPSTGKRYWLALAVNPVSICQKRVCVCLFLSYVALCYLTSYFLSASPFAFISSLIMPCHIGFLSLSVKQARYISNQPLWPWYNICIKFTSPRSAYSSLLIVHLSTQTLPLRKQLPVSLSTLINFIFSIAFISSGLFLCINLFKASLSPAWGQGSLFSSSPYAQQQCLYADSGGGLVTQSCLTLATP